ncbi:MAG: amidohydrolase [Verrucomicrobiales bacterium]|nr:amidohydrolase [Verrucomicrobiales bacterium]
MRATHAHFVITNAQVLTVDTQFRRAQAIAVRGERIAAVGSNRAVARWIGPGTRVLNAHGRTVMPGLIDSHTHAYRASVSELDGPQPVFDSIAQALAHIRSQTARTPPGTWIVLQRVYPTRLAEGRLPTKAELDTAAPAHPVLWNAGPVCMVNSKALELAGIKPTTPDPTPGEIVKDPRTGEPTGLLHDAAHLLPVRSGPRQPTAADHRAALKHLYHLYNQHGITSIGERRGDPEVIELCRDLAARGELTVRVNLTRIMQPVPRTLEEAIHRLDTFTNAPSGQLPFGPTGVGDDWVRIGPFKLWLDGGMLIGTAFMREPWGVGDTYQITDPDYRGILNVPTNLLNDLMLAAAQRGWQLTAHCAGEAATDVLLDAYEHIHKHLDIRTRRFHITHGNFTSPENLARCRQLGVAVDLQPAWLYKDGASLLRTLGERRMKWFLPCRTWWQRGIKLAGGSDHMIGLDSFQSTNPWNPWLGMWIALTRQTERGGVLNPDERLSREQAIRLYTLNGAWLTFEDARKGSLEPGKLADLILVDRDILNCPVDDVRSTKVLLTMVGGKIVWETR